VLEPEDALQPGGAVAEPAGEYSIMIFLVILPYIRDCHLFGENWPGIETKGLSRGAGFLAASARLALGEWRRESRCRPSDHAAPPPDHFSNHQPRTLIESSPRYF
jgi:hypothetical protein